ncbi:pyrroloquinoline quinone biosynthesis protein PqqE [Pseudomonas sp. nanlin1]|uniref:pyrroloquinoline quinone biosynthesis protein PqqE n=1 Tax=Pseudomonas sp. nanlin1 TaxID=3040605 RepID=UPI00388CF87B
MDISGSTAYYAGLSSIQAGTQRVDQAASQIANNSVERSVTSQSSDYQAERLRSVDRSQQMDFATSTVQMNMGLVQVQAGTKVEKAADEMLGTLIDTYA